MKFANGKRYWPERIGHGWAELGRGRSIYSPAAMRTCSMPQPKTTAAAPAPNDRQAGAGGVASFRSNSGRHQFFHLGSSSVRFRTSSKDADGDLPPRSDASISAFIQMCRSAEDHRADDPPPTGRGRMSFYGVKEYPRRREPALDLLAGAAPARERWVSKEMTQVLPPRITLLIDTFLPDRSLESHGRRRTRALGDGGFAGIRSAGAGTACRIHRMDLVRNGRICLPTAASGHRRDLLGAIAKLPDEHACTSGRELLEEKAIGNVENGATCDPDHPEPCSLGPGGKPPEETCSCLLIYLRRNGAMGSNLTHRSISTCCIPFDQEPDEQNPKQQAATA